MEDFYFFLFLWRYLLISFDYSLLKSFLDSYITENVECPRNEFFVLRFLKLAKLHEWNFEYFALSVIFNLKLFFFYFDFIHQIDF
jgi:hypothetical protein